MGLLKDKGFTPAMAIAIGNAKFGGDAKKATDFFVQATQKGLDSTGLYNALIKDPSAKAALDPFFNKPVSTSPVAAPIPGTTSIPGTTPIPGAPVATPQPTVAPTPVQQVQAPQDVEDSIINYRQPNDVETLVNGIGEASNWIGDNAKNVILKPAEIVGDMYDANQKGQENQEKYGEINPSEGLIKQEQRAQVARLYVKNKQEKDPSYNMTTFSKEFQIGPDGHWVKRVK